MAATSRPQKRAPSASALLLAALTLALSPDIAIAEEAGDPTAQAEARHNRGLELFQAGDFAAAAQEFEAAQALAPSPANLFNLARCREQLGDLDGAIATLERFLASEGLPEEPRARGESELARLRAASDPDEGAQPPPDEGDGEGSPDDGEVAPTPDPGPDEAPPQRYDLTIAFQLGAGAAFTLSSPRDQLEAGALVDLEIAGGLQFGRHYQGGRVDLWLLRAELILGLAGQLGGPGIFEVTGAGRLSLSLGRLPLRLEGEVGLGLSLFHPGEGAAPDLMVLFSAAVVYQISSWLEVALRPMRLELLDLVEQEAGQEALTLRYGLDLQVRFRL